MKKLSKFLFHYSNLNSSILVSRCLYSTNRDHDVKPVAVYLNCEQEKARIFQDNKGKAAVYRLINNLNNKIYIGSTVNLSTRFYKYFSLKYLTQNKTPIHNALLKYGFENFTLEILEYCESGVNPIEREQDYFLQLKPEYNILKQAGSSLGYKHTAATLEIFNQRKVSAETINNLSLAATGRVLTEEEKNKISDARRGITLSEETRSKISAAAIRQRGVTVKVKNMHTEVELEFASLTEAAKHIGVSRPAVKKYSDTGKLIQGIFLVNIK